MKKGMYVLIVIALMAVLVGVGYAAYFSDTETRTDNNITAGWLRLSNTQDGSPFYLGYHLAVGNNNFKPGDSETHKYQLFNEGTVDGNVYVGISWWETLENGRQEREQLAGDPSTYYGELQNVVILKLEADVDCDGTMDSVLMNKYITNINTNKMYKIGLVPGNPVGTTENYNKVCMDLTAYWPETGSDAEDNKAMTDVVNFDLKFSLIQPH